MKNPGTAKNSFLILKWKEVKVSGIRYQTLHFEKVHGMLSQRSAHCYMDRILFSPAI